jgi:hypothetical protein
VIEQLAFQGTNVSLDFSQSVCQLFESVSYCIELFICSLAASDAVCCVSDALCAHGKSLGDSERAIRCSPLPNWVPLFYFSACLLEA